MTQTYSEWRDSQEYREGSMHFLIVLAVIAFFVAVFSMIGASRSAVLNAVADCVHAQAVHANYAGDPYTREAWETFAPLCK